MNFSKNLKWQVVLAALGFSLLLTGRANSQEIVNSDFATPSTSVSGNFNNVVPAQENNAAAVAPESVYTPASAISIQANNEMQQLKLSVSSLPKEAGLLVAIAILLLCCAVVKKVMSNRYDDARSTWNSSPVRAKTLPSRKPQPILS